MKLKPLIEVTGTTRADQVRLLLTDLVRQLGPGLKLPTTRELRKTMRVSQVTLDTAMTNMEARGLIDRRHGSGVYVSSLAGLRRIGVVLAHGVPEARFETFDNILLRAIQSAASVRNCLVDFHFSEDDQADTRHGPHRLATEVKNGRIDAIVVRGVPNRLADELRSLEVPCVYVTSSPKATPRVAMDQRHEVVRIGARLLMERGCKRIAFAHPASKDDVAPPELLIFQKAIRSAGLETIEQWLMPFDTRSITNRPLNASREFFERWRDGTSHPDGLLSCDDQFTAGALHAMHLLKLNVPRDVIVASHANRGLELFGSTPVIRLQIDPADIANAVLETVDQLLAPRGAVTSVRNIEPHLLLPNDPLDSSTGGNSTSSMIS